MFKNVNQSTKQKKNLNVNANLTSNNERLHVNTYVTKCSTERADGRCINAVSHHHT